MTDLCSLTIVEAAACIARRTLSPRELTRACLDRIAAHDGVLNSFIAVTADRAEDAARRAEQQAMDGDLRGPLHGIPFALKDIYDTAGIATTGHSALCRSRVPVRDAATVEKLRVGGAVLLGKLSTHEFATGGPSYDLPFPPARNPWNLSRFPGGSSSGSGVAVAAGLAPMAMGSDTGGSIRLPAAFCGVTGIKPTYGRVSKRGVLPLSWTMDNAGPLTRTVADCARALQAVAGFDPEDPGSVDRAVPDFSAALQGGLAGVRIGLIRHFYEIERTDPQVIAAMDAAVEVFRKLGAEVRTITLAPLADYQACMRLIILAESFAIHGEALRTTPELYGEVLRYRLIPGAFVTGSDYVQAQRWQRMLARDMDAVMNDHDVLLTACAWGEAPVMAAMRAEANFASPPLTPPFNVSAMPAISICNGFSQNGLPLAMQIAGRRFDEASVFRVAHAYEQAAGWMARRPAIPAEPVHDTPIDQVARTPDPTEREQVRLRAERVGFTTLAPRQLDQLCEALPHVEALRQRLPGGFGFGREPANTFNP